MICKTLLDRESALQRTKAASFDGLLEHISEEQLLHGVAHTPQDEFVIWSGVAFKGRDASIRARVLDLVSEIWTPVSVRELVRIAARLSGHNGISPNRVRGAIRTHQGAVGSTYFLVRRTSSGEFAAVTDIPLPVVGRSVSAGETVLSADGRRFGPDV